MRITFFKTPRPKQFNYIPRYYDQQKEEAEERQKRIERELGIKQKNGYRPGITKGTMTRKVMDKRRTNRSSVIRLLIIITILTALVMYLMSGNFEFTFLPN